MICVTRHKRVKQHTTHSNLDTLTCSVIHFDIKRQKHISAVYTIDASISDYNYIFL